MFAVAPFVWEVPFMTDRLSWLQTHTPLRSLSLQALEAIAAALRTESIAANRRIVLEDTPVTHLIILRSGELEAYHTTRDRPATVTTLLAGTVLHWLELVMEQRAPQTIITLTDCQLWTLSREVFATLVTQFPELRQQVSQQLQNALSDLVHEQERQAVLRPYLVPRVKQGIVGSSRYAVRLRQGIKDAASDRQPVLIFGEPGLEKDNIAALIHYGSGDRRQPLIRFNCGTLSAHGAELFGKLRKPGLLDWLAEGTLILNNVHEWPTHLYPQLRRLVAEQTYEPVAETPVPPPPLSRASDPDCRKEKLRLPRPSAPSN